MSQPIKSISKISRSLGEKLFLKGSRDDGPKNAVTRRPYPPGQHGQSRRGKPSDYYRQLKEKQKLRYIYNLSEKQLRKLVVASSKSSENTADRLLEMLQFRLDNIIYLGGYAESRRQARQIVSHRKVELNGRKISIPSAMARVNDKLTITVEAIDKDSARKRAETPNWLDVNPKDNTITVVSKPTANENSLLINAQLIIEYYSRLM